MIANYGLLKGLKGLILGISNEHSIAYGTAEAAVENGAEIIINYMDEKYKEKLDLIGQNLGAKGNFYYNANEEDSLDSFFKEVKKTFGTIDFIVHSIVFSDKNELSGPYMDVTRKNMANSMIVSVHSFTEIVKKFHSITNPGGSYITISYYGGKKIVPNYNVMASCKAALECSVRYLSDDVGKKNIRVNAVSTGPIRTLAASAIGNFSHIIDYYKKYSPLRRVTTMNDIKGANIAMLSPLSAGITGQTIYVDSGYSSVGVPKKEEGED